MAEIWAFLSSGIIPGKEVFAMALLQILRVTLLHICYSQTNCLFHNLTILLPYIALPIISITHPLPIL